MKHSLLKGGGGHCIRLENNQNIQGQKVHETYKAQETPESYKIQQALPGVVEAGPIAVERGLPRCAACQSCRERQGHRHIQNAAVSESPALLEVINNSLVQ